MREPPSKPLKPLFSGHKVDFKWAKARAKTIKTIATTVFTFIGLLVFCFIYLLFQYNSESFNNLSSAMVLATIIVFFTSILPLIIIVNRNSEFNIFERELKKRRKKYYANIKENEEIKKENEVIKAENERNRSNWESMLSDKKDYVEYLNLKFEEHDSLYEIWTKCANEVRNEYRYDDRITIAKDNYYLINHMLLALSHWSRGNFGAVDQNPMTVSKILDHTKYLFITSSISAHESLKEKGLI